MMDIYKNKITNNENIWMKLAYFSLRIDNEDTNVVTATIEIAYSYWLVPGYGKVVTCFIVRFLKENFPSKKIKLILSNSSKPGVWESHGFVEDKSIFTTHSLNFDKSDKICKETFEKFKVTEFKYYDI